MENSLKIEGLDLSGIEMPADPSLKIEGLDYSSINEKPEQTPWRDAQAFYYNVKKGAGWVASGVENVNDYLTRNYRKTPMWQEYESYQKNVFTEKHLAQGANDEQARILGAQEFDNHIKSRVTETENKISKLPGLQLPIEFDGISSGFIEDVFATMGGIVPTMGAAMINPAIGTMTMWAQIQGALSESIGKEAPSLSEDKKFELAATAATIETPFEALSELFMIRSFVPRGAWRALAARLVQTSLVEGGTELIQEFPEIAAMTMALNPDMSWADIGKQTFLNIESWKQAGYSFLLGAVVGGVIPGTAQATSLTMQALTNPEQQRINAEKFNRAKELIFKENPTKADLKEALSLSNLSENKINEIIKNNEVDKIVTAVKEHLFQQRQLSESDGRKNYQEALGEKYDPESATVLTSLQDELLKNIAERGGFEDIEDAYNKVVFKDQKLEDFLKENNINVDFQNLDDDSLLGILAAPWQKIDTAEGIEEHSKLRFQTSMAIQSGEFEVGGAMRFGNVSELKKILKAGNLMVSDDHGRIHATPIMSKADAKDPPPVYGSYNVHNFGIYIPPEYTMPKPDAHTAEVLVKPDTPLEALRFLIDGQMEIYDIQSLKEAMNKQYGEALYQENKANIKESRNFKRWFGDSKVVDENGAPLVVYHGTTMDFDSFEKSKANPESDLGAGFYFTSNEDDVSINYAGMGADLTNKVQRTAERIAQETDREYDDPSVVEEAKAKFMSHQGATMPVYLSIKNPVILEDGGGTYLESLPDIEYYKENVEDDEMVDKDDYEDDDSYQEALEEKAWNYYYEDYNPVRIGNASELIDAVQTVSNRFGIDNPLNAGEISLEDGMYANDFISTLKSNESVMYIEDEDGNLASNEFVRQVFEESGFDGFIDRTVYDKFGPGRDAGKPMDIDYGTEHYIVFNPTQIKSATGNVGTFDPNNPNILMQDKDQPLGAYTLDEAGRHIIHAFEGADISTPIHESAHMTMEVLHRLDDPDYYTAGKWAGVDADRLADGYSAWTKAEKEKIARGFEIYMMEGKSPSQKLRDVFAKIKQMMIDIYKSVKNLETTYGIKLDDNIRNVFDGWLSTQEEQNNNAFLEVPEWLNAEPTNTELSLDPTYEEINQKAREIAIEKVRKNREKFEKALEISFRKDAEETVNEEIKIFGVMNDIVNAKGINRESLERVHGRAVAEDLHSRRPGLVGKNGVPLDELAEWYGYDTEQDLLDDILNSPPKKTLIDAYVNEMWRGYEAGLDYMNAEIYEEVINEEINIFNKLLEPSTKKHKEFGGLQEDLGKVKQYTGRPNLKRFEELNQADLELDEVKELRKQVKEDQKIAGQAWREGNREGIIKQKIKQKERVAKLRYDAKIKEERHRIWKRMNRHIRQPATRLPLEYKKHVNAILSRYAKIPKTFDVGNPSADLITFLSELRNKGEHVAELESYIKYALPDPTTQGKLPIEDLRTIAGMADMIVGLGKNEGKLIKGNKRIELDEKVNECIQSHKMFYGDKQPISPDFNNEVEHYQGLSRVKRAIEKGKDLEAGLSRVEFLLKAADGWQYTGNRPNHSIYAGIKKANDFKLVKGKEVLGKLKKIFKPFQSKWAGQMVEINWKGTKQQWAKEQLILMALNDGNSGNRNAMMKGYSFDKEAQRIGKDGEKLFDESMRDVWSKLNPKERQLVYNVWDLLESFYADLNKVHMELTGAELKKVEGFYFPLVANYKLSPRARLFSELENIKDLFSGHALFHNVKAGFRMERTGASFAPDLSFRVINNHIEGVLHDITHQIPIRNAKMIIQHPAYRESFVRAFGESAYNQLLPWLQHTARPNSKDTSGHEWFAGKIRRHATVAALAWRLTTGFKQFPSAFQTIEALNTVYKKAGIKGEPETMGGVVYAKALGRFMADMKGQFDLVNSMSPEMEARKYSYDRDRGDLFKEMTEANVFKGKNKVLSNSFFVFIRAVDMVASYSSWLAAYDAGLKIYTDKNGTPNIDNVIEFADEIVRETQPISFMKDLSLYQRGGKHQSNWIKLFAMFSGFFNIFYNRNRTTLQRIGAKDITAGEMVNIGIWRILVSTMIAGWIMRREEWEIEDIPADMFNFILSTIPVVRDISSGLMYGRSYSMTPLGGMVESVASATRRTYRHLTDDDYTGGLDVTAKEYMRALGYLTGFPSSAANQAFDGLMDLMEGDTSNPLRMVIPEARPRKKKKHKKGWLTR